MELLEALYPFLYGYVFLVVGFYHLIISIVFKSRIFTYYVILTVGLGIHFLLRYLTGPNPQIEDPSVLSALAVLIGSLLFSHSYLNVKGHTRMMSRVCYALIAVSLVIFAIQALNILIISSPAITSLLASAAALMALIGTLFQLFLGFFLIKMEKTAKTYLITMLPLLIAAVGYIVVWYLQSGYDIPWWVKHMIGNLMILQMILFAVILALKFRATQAEQLALQEEMNIKLENEVEKQTKELKANNRELEEANKLKQKLISIITHDVRSPLQQLNSLLLLMRGNGGSFDQSDKFISATRKNISSLSASMENLLQWSNSQLGGMEAKKEVVNLNSFLKEFNDEFSALLEAKDQKLVCDETDAQISFDPNMLKIVLRNLVHNAVKFSEEGETIQISAKQMENSVRISVIDRGVGMDPEWFNDDDNTKKNTQLGTNSEKGSGFGLTIVKDLVRLNGGEIQCQSSSEDGTTFEINLQNTVEVKTS